jgi:hypothetical protein
MIEPAFSTTDLEVVSALAAGAWRAGRDRDWSARAGTLEWSCTRTADHAVDTLLAPAFFLASRRLDGYPALGGNDFTVGPDATPDDLIECLETATRILVAVVSVAEPSARAVIRRRPEVQTAGPEDFAPRGGLELILHAHDVCVGLGVAFDPPAEVARRLREHTRHWPTWVGPGNELGMSDDPWGDLLAGSGRRRQTPEPRPSRQEGHAP